jgi:hypothetical protein
MSNINSSGHPYMTLPLTRVCFFDSRFSFLSGLVNKDKLNDILYVFDAKTKEELIEKNK